MLPKTYRQLLAKQKALQEKWLKIDPTIKNVSGIYILTRHEDGFNYAYVGQATWILTRLGTHLEGYEQHIDKSLRKHGLYSADNPNGWNVGGIVYCDESLLDEKERQYIRMYANGYQLLNKTTGGQDGAKHGLDADVQVKGYNKGVKYGRAKALKEVAEYFGKYLDFVIKGKPNKIKERKYNAFEILIGGTENGIEDDRGYCGEDIE